MNTIQVAVCFTMTYLNIYYTLLSEMSMHSGDIDIYTIHILIGWWSMEHIFNTIHIFDAVFLSMEDSIR